MRTPLPDYLAEVLDTCRDDESGTLADYIPELADADPSTLALTVCTIDGILYTVGDGDAEVTIQSISKPFAYALALADHGLDAVLEKVGVEPSGEAFNEISLESDTGRPLNPMINAGAITVHSLLDDERVRTGFAAFAGRALTVDERVMNSEIETADRNRAIAYMLRNHGIIDVDPPEAVAGYTRQCSYLVTVADLAAMVTTLANAGVQPHTGERVVPRWVARQALSVMTTCGMYDAAGDWFTTVGIPAKSGVSGGLVGAVPGKGGAAVLSPRLDAHGNSVRGIKVFERLSRDMGMHLLDSPPPARPLAHTTAMVDGDGDGNQDTAVFELQGAVDFPGVERLLRDLAEQPPSNSTLVLDLGHVSEVRDVGRRMLLEGVRRLSLDGHHIILIDPDDLLEGPEGPIEVGDGGDAEVVRAR